MSDDARRDESDGSGGGSLDEQVGRVLDDYLAALEAGHPADATRLLTENQEIADRLRDGLELLGLADCLIDPHWDFPHDASLTQTQEGSDGRRDLAAPARVRYFGDYVLSREIARGGMGVVYRARQRSLNRPVALKMILAGVFASESDVLRFRAEAEAAANLDHPNIVPIYEVGQHDGHDFFSMRLLDGGSLSQHLDRFATDPRGAARLVVEIARAVHHAHQRGVLHRDLKPSNILLDSEGRPHVADFGLASRTGSTDGLTRTGAILGSPPYMAPEQAATRRGAITTSSDVYGLGAILYALLAGRPPFQADSTLETLEQVRTREPEPPSRDGRRADRDLETICLKCLRKEPSQRYGSAEALADDLERWVRGEPIAARPSGRVERAWRWARRNPAVATLAGAVALLLVAAIAGLTASNLMIRREQKRTAANLELARRAVEEYLTKVGESRLLNEPGLQPLRKELLESALKYYQSLLAQDANDRRLRFDLGEGYIRVGDIKALLGARGEALEAYRAGLEIHRAMAESTPSNRGYQWAFASAQERVGQQLLEQGDLAPARSHLEQALAIVDRLARADPRDEWSRQTQATSEHHLSIIIEKTGDFTGAERHARRAITIAEPLVAARPEEPEYLDDLVIYRQHLAELLIEQGRFAHAKVALTGTIETLEAAISGGRGTASRRWVLSSVFTSLGHIQESQERWDDSRRSHRRAYEIQEALVAANPNVPGYRASVAASCVHLAFPGHRRVLSKEVPGLLRFGQRGKRLYRELAEADPRNPDYLSGLVALSVNVSHTHLYSGDLESACESLREAIQAGERLMRLFPGDQKGRERLATAYLDLAEIQLSREGAETARPSYERCRDLSERIIAERPGATVAGELLVVSLHRISIIDLGAGRFAEAERAARRNVERGWAGMRARPDLALHPPHMTGLACFGLCHHDVGRALEAQGKIEEAIEWYDHAIPILRDAIRREPRDRFAPQWLAEALAMKERATARLIASQHMPNGRDAFAESGHVSLPGASAFGRE